MVKENIQYITIENEAYPERLRHIYKPPKALYVRGNLPEQAGIGLAIVGARNCSAYGKEIAFHFAKELARNGIEVISGVARGIDGAAHKGALACKGRTYGVLGCGIDVYYPKEHAKLYEQIELEGGIISEYGIGVAPLAGYFPMRNRIISGLANGILVIEARAKSGSLITVEYGLEQGKDIFVIPGRIFDELSKGCNRLLKAGAIPVTEPVDILEYYGIEQCKNVDGKKKNNNLLEKQEKIVYSRLCLVPKHLNQVVAECQIPIADVMQSLISLERKGYIKQPLKCYYIKQLE
ncbi:MAG: DNA-processing protein DprA [Velocimicrobium sp.]